MAGSAFLMFAALLGGGGLLAGDPVAGKMGGFFARLAAGAKLPVAGFVRLPSAALVVEVAGVIRLGGRGLMPEKGRGRQAGPWRNGGH